MKNITFLNTCSTQDWASGKDKEFRSKANEFLTKVITDSPLFTGNQSVSVEYYQEGISSIVAKVMLPDDQKFVFKTNSRSWLLQSEIIGLQTWVDIGIKTPKVHETGEYNNYPYYIMDCFENTTLANSLDKELISPTEIGAIIGEFFFVMQKVTGQGFGRKFSKENGKLVGRQTSLSEYIDQEFKDKELLGTLQKNAPNTLWQELLNTHIHNIEEQYDASISILGNFDMSPRHIFTTEPPTLFDPLPELAPKYFDIAMYLMPVNGTYKGSHLIRRKATIDSYIQLEGSIPKEIVTSAIWLLTYRKCANLLQKTNENRTARALHMISVIGNTESFDAYIKLYFN